MRVARDEAIEAAQEALNAGDAVFLPIEIAIGRGREERIKARGVGPELRDHVVGRNHVAEILRHLGAVFDHHALCEQALGGLVVLDDADVAHHFRPEARIDQVQNGVFYAADVLVDRKPAGDRCRIKGAWSLCGSQ